MREIKFRAWDKVEKHMDYEALAYNLINAINGNDDSLTAEEKLRYEVMQYTDLKDKNGKEIYDKDVVLVGYDGTPKTINFPQDYNWLELQHKNMQVIGNIYENLELLKD